MTRPRRLNAQVTKYAKTLAVQARSADELRHAQCVLLPALLGATLEQTAAVLGVGRATVGRYQAKVRSRLAQPSQPIAQRGGRRRELMSLQEEREFLRPWVELSAQGTLLVVGPLRAALAQKLGRPVTHSVIYRLLARHGWRKVAPDTRHPKSEPAAQERWKKNFPACWQAGVDPKRSAGDPSG